MLSDELLYDRLLEGDLSAFDALYDRYERPLFGWLFKQLGDIQEAEDVFHEAFLAVLKERDAGRSATSFRAWLYQAARHLCLNRVRTRHRAARALEVEARSPPGADSEHPERTLERQQLAVAVRAAAARQSPPLAELYQLRASGLSYEELAHVLEVPIGTVKSRMHELITRLREELKQ